MLRGNNAKSARGDYRAILLQRFAPIARGQIGQLQFRRAAPLHGMKMNRAALRRSAEMAMRFHSSRARSLGTGVRCTERSTGGGDNHGE
jgi:hypothetical protein